MTRMRRADVVALLEERAALTEVQDHIDVNGLSHLSVRRRGRSITIIDVSGDEDEPRARLTSLQDGTWQLSFPTWNGERWEKTPVALHAQWQWSLHRRWQWQDVGVGGPPGSRAWARDGSVPIDALRQGRQGPETREGALVGPE